MHPPLPLRRRLAALLALCAVAALSRGALAAEDAAAAPAGAGERGERTLYRIEYRSEGRTRLSSVLSGKGKGTSAAPALDSDFASSVRGVASLTILESSAEGRLAAFRMDGARVRRSSGGVLDAARTEAARRALAATAFLDLSPAGSIRSVWLDPVLDEPARTLVRTVIAAAQLVLPGGARAPPRSWEAEEEDPTGRYAARYETLGGPTARGGIAFRKTKLRYLPPAPAGDGARQLLAPEVRASGSLDGRLDPRRGSLISLAGVESQRFVLNGREIARARNSVRIDLADRTSLDEAGLRPLDDARALLVRDENRTSLFAPRTAKSAGKALAASQLGQTTADEVLAELGAAETRSGDARETARTRVYLKLRALAVLHPEACPRLAEVLATAAPGGLAFEVIPLALAEAGSPEAQAALASVLRTRAADVAAVRVIVLALARLQEVAPVAEDALAGIAFGDGDAEVASSAQLALGAQAHALADRDRGRADAIVARLSRALDAARAPQPARMLLLALGNAGVPSAFQAIRRRVDDPAPDVRAAAVAALRFQADPEAERLLLSALERDPDLSVRLEASSALAYRPASPEAVEAQLRVLASAAPEAIRLAVLRSLWSARDRFDAAAGAVARAAASDPSENVRKEAARLRAGATTR